MAETIRTNTLIIGAGLAGLVAAQHLAHPTILIDKGRRPGGRLATRPLGPGMADHGAQFFTVRTPEFQAQVDRWLAKGLVFKWSNGWSDGSLGSTPTDGHPRYAVRDGIAQLPLSLANKLNIRARRRVVSVREVAGGWQALDDHGQIYDADRLLMTPPVPQALDLLATSGVALDPADRDALEPITYHPCLAGVFWVNGEIHLPEPGAVQRPNATVTWIADNRRKGISPQATVITVHAGPAYSRDLWDQPDWQIVVALEAALRPFKDLYTSVVEARLKRWRYATPVQTHPEHCLVAQGLPPLVFAGDGFGAPRTEGAYLSGLAASAALS